MILNDYIESKRNRIKNPDIVEGGLSHETKNGMGILHCVTGGMITGIIGDVGRGDIVAGARDNITIILVVSEKRVQSSYNLLSIIN
ncbi:MAG: hypothetical protein Q7T80_17115 [Methanoregula sp.]|nr:hypothetical protein [Methanoregula sp.]